MFRSNLVVEHWAFSARNKKYYIESSLLIRGELREYLFIKWTNLFIKTEISRLSGTCQLRDLLSAHFEIITYTTSFLLCFRSPLLLYETIFVIDSLVVSLYIASQYLLFARFSTSFQLVKIENVMFLSKMCGIYFTKLLTPSTVCFWF